MFISDFHFDAPSGGELLAEIGVNRHTIREIVEDERAIRCPDRDSVLPDRPRAIFAMDTPFERALHEAALIEILGSFQSHPPAE